MSAERAKGFMKKFVRRTILCGRAKEKGRLDEKEVKGEEKVFGSMKGAKKKERRGKTGVGGTERHCACCLKPFIILRGVQCIDCGARICKNNCSRLQQHFYKCWCCLFCYQQRAYLLKNIHLFDTCSSNSFEYPFSPDSPPLRTDKLTVDAIFLARIALRKLIDRAFHEVCKLSNSENFASNNTCDDQHEEHEETELSRSSYDDLLKMVIVNKVIEKSDLKHLKTSSDNSNMDQIENIYSVNQNCNGRLKIISQDICNNECNQTYKVTRRRTTESFMIDEKFEEITEYLSDENIEFNTENCLNYQKSHLIPFPEYGVDIIDPYQTTMEEIEDEVKDSSCTKIISLVESWQDNWYFRKKNVKHHSKFVSMFVPNSNTQCRVMIGDKDIDETSDLSEYSVNSDEEYIAELTLPIKNDSLVFTNNDINKITLINNKNKSNSTEKVIETRILNEQVSTEADEKSNKNSNHLSSISNIYPTTTSLDEKIPNIILKENIPMALNDFNHYLEDRANINLSDNLSSINSLLGIHKNIVDSDEIIKIEDQQDSEYTEQDILVTEKHCFEKEKIFQVETIVENINVDNHSQLFEKKTTEAEIELNTPPKPGSIAEREHKKWENAASLKNNPYSKENIEKRLLEKNYVGFFNLSRYPVNYRIDEPVIQKKETKKLVKSDDEMKRLNEDKCKSINSNISNTDKQNRIENIGSNANIDKDFELIKTNSETTLNITNYNISIDLVCPDVIQLIDEPLSSNNNEIFEHERKNNKNEIRAKLNNKEAIVDDKNEKIHNKQSICIENQVSSTQQINCKVCACEKNKLVINKSTEQRLVNKLDVKSTTYLEESILKTKSIKKLKDKKYKDNGQKSNLAKRKHLESINSFKTVATDDDILDCYSKNNKILNQITSDESALKSSSCKSVICINNENIENKLIKYEDGNKNQNKVIVENFIENQDSNNNKKSKESTKSDTESSDSLINYLKTNQDNNKKISPCINEVGYSVNYIKRNVSMPSVKKLVQIFDNKHQENISDLMDETNSNELENKGIKSHQGATKLVPRHLHSITARSLSKEFRKGLR